jgi:hypothetical protein
VPGFVVEDETPRDGLPSDDLKNENGTGFTDRTSLEAQKGQPE